MPSDLFDVAIIGGGVNGCGVARDAAGRGARVLLLEAGDLASGTSSASTKLIHGGLRYLEHYEFALVRESLVERERLLQIAPHIIWPLRFVLPHRPGLRPRWLLRLGLFLYDHLGARKRLPASSSIDLSRHPAGTALKAGFNHGFAYSDCWVDDARLVVLNARDAADRGAQVHTHCRVDRLARAGDIWLIEAGDDEFRARSVVNAAGPAVLDVLDRSGEPHGVSMRLVRGSHIVVPRLFDHDFAYFFQNPDGRIFFAIPYEQDFTLIGTTDRDHHGSLGDVTPSAEEIDYLCASASDYFRAAVRPDDVVWRFAGVRPLIDDGSGRPESATRGYRLIMSAIDEGAPLLSVLGGKITTYRYLAEELVDLLATRLPLLDQPRWTATSPLPGGDFAVEAVARQVDALQKRYPFLQPGWANRLIRSYGMLASTILGDAVKLADCGEHFGAGLTAREVDYLADREWARTTEDILWRRSKLGLHINQAGIDALSHHLQERGIS